MTITKKRNAAMFLAALMIALLCMILVAPVSAYADNDAAAADTAAADHVGHPHLLGVTGFGDLVCPAVDEYIECIVDVPHRAADNAADTGAGEGQTDESRRVTRADGALESDRHCGADICRVGQIPCDCAAGSDVRKVSDLQGNADQHSRLHISHNDADDEGRHERTAEAVPADGIADD